MQFTYLSKMLHVVILCSICTSKLEQMQSRTIQVSNIMCAMVIPLLSGTIIWTIMTPSLVVARPCLVANLIL